MFNLLLMHFVITRLISDQIALQSVQLPLLIEIDIYSVFFEIYIYFNEKRQN